MIKLKLGDVRQLIEPLKKLSLQELPVKYSWKIVCLCENIEKLVDKVEKFRVELVHKYGDDFLIYTDIESNETVYFTDEDYAAGKIDETKYSLTSKRKEIRNSEKLNKFHIEFNELLSVEEDVIDEKIDLSNISDSIIASAQELFILKHVFIF